jgi:hypothetical protein
MTSEDDQQETGIAMNDHFRVSDADRARAAALLRVHFAAGRLTADEMDDRIAATLAATTLSDLRQLLADLPGTVTVRQADCRLERGYRRLLALYPARYRRVHKEEMLAVLMTAVPEGKCRLGLAEAADLIVGALRVWCQSAIGWAAGWRGVAVLTSAGAVLGLLAGIVFATVKPPLKTSSALVVLSGPVTPATARVQLALVSDHAVLAPAAQAAGPAMSAQALQSRLHISLVTKNAMAITAQATTAAQAERSANAVADSYIVLANGNAHNGHRKLRAVLLDQAVITLGPSQLADVLDTSGLGALCGAFLGATAAVALTRPGRIRMT